MSLVMNYQSEIEELQKALTEAVNIRRHTANPYYEDHCMIAAMGVFACIPSYVWQWLEERRHTENTAFKSFKVGRREMQIRWNRNIHKKLNSVSNLKLPMEMLHFWFHTTGGLFDNYWIPLSFPIHNNERVYSVFRINEKTLSTCDNPVGIQTLHEAIYMVFMLQKNDNAAYGPYTYVINDVFCGRHNWKPNPHITEKLAGFNKILI